MQRKWITFLGLLLSSVLLIILSQAQPALSIAPPAATVTKIAADMGKLIGRKPTRPILITDKKSAPSIFAQSIKDAAGHGAVTIAATKEGGKWREQDEGETMDTCWIVWLSSYANDAQDKSLLAHEIYHCFQNELLGVNQLPEWFIEGSAMWAGEEYAGGTKMSSPMWKDYLSGEKSLFDRGYDAIGFYAHLKNSGVDVWKRLDSIMKTASNDSDGLFNQFVKSAGDSFLTTWASGLARKSEAGADWNTIGPGITADKRSSKATTVSSSSPLSREITRGTQALYEINVPSGKIIQFDIKGYGALRWTGGSSDILKFSQVFNKRYCVGETCRCENGNSPSGVESAPSNQVLLAVTGTTRSTKVDVTAEDNSCKEKKPNSGSGNSGGSSGNTGSNSPNSGNTKTGASYGDPHLITFDGFRYSFQTIGEFLLSQSQDQKFVVQTRQAQVPGQELTLNRAVALKVGNDRIGFYTAKDSAPIVRVNGDVSTSDRRSFADGSMQKRGDREYVVQWNSGEQATIRLIEVAKMTFLNVTLNVPNRSNRYTGLLGNLDGNAANDLRTRSGKVIPTKSSYGQFTSALSNLLPTPIPLSSIETAFLDQLHREFGDSWRIQQSESLFDYEAGQSTETFSDRRFPRRYLTLGSLMPAQLRSAEAVCRNAGVEANLLEGCIFDVGLTNQPGFAQAAANALVQGVIDRAVDRVIDQVQEKIPVKLPVRIRFPW
ncbi:VWD domain-containing protein [Cyanobacteria bacterium FACHB-DQ100]|nr:VWD domain-containing protein [Cyanobacteria bacterium FACHB-DQ100]